MLFIIKVFGNNQNKQAEVAKPGQALFSCKKKALAETKNKRLNIMRKGLQKKAQATS